MPATKQLAQSGSVGEAGAEPAPRVRVRTRRPGRGRPGTALPPWGFVVPAVVVFAAFFLVPNLLNFVYPFTNWSGYHDDVHFTGLTNLRALLHDGTLGSALRITLEYAVAAALFQNLFGLGLALLLERNTVLNRVLRTMFFLPVLISALAVGYIFQALLSPHGALNSGIAAIVGHPVTSAWLGSTTWTLFVVAVVHGWKWMGLAMLVYLAGLKSVPEEMIEAARIDGASRWQTFRLVRWPLLAPAVTFNVAAALIGSLNTFDIVQATTGGGPARTTQVLDIYVFQVFGEGLYAQATAMSLVLFLVASVLAVPLVTYLRRRERAV
jgi:raffinose/stachyose/melibiose transport system permease protein